MKRITIIGIACILSFCFCGKKVMIQKYYLIEIPVCTAPDSVQIQHLLLNVDVRDFQISRAINQTRIALRSNSNELDYYFYHHWAVRPASGIADMVYYTIEKQHLFQRLVRGYSSQSDYLITGDILHLERDETKKQISAHISGTIECIDQKTGIAVFQHTFDRNEPLKNPKSMNDFAQTISSLLMEETEHFVLKIADYFNQNQPEANP